MHLWRAHGPIEEAGQTSLLTRIYVHIHKKPQVYSKGSVKIEFFFDENFALKTH